MLVVNTSATLPASLDAVAAAACRPAASLRPAARRTVGGRAPPPDRPLAPARPALTAPPASRSPRQLALARRRAGDRRSRSRAAARAELRLPASAAAATAGPVRLWVATLRSARSRCSPTWPATAGPSATRYVPQSWPISSYQTVFAEVPGSAEMPSAARPFSAERDHPPGIPGRRDRPLRPALRGLLPGAARAPDAGVVPGPADHRRPGQRGPPGRRPGHRRGHHGRPGPRNGGRRPRRGPSRARVGPSWWSRRRPDRPGRRRAADRLARARRVSIWPCSRPSPEPDLVGASYAAALAAGYLWHEFGDSHLVLP